MKTLITIIAICFLSSISFGQTMTLFQRKNTIEKLKKTTLVVATGYDKEFDEAVKFAFDKYWKITPLKYVNKKEKDLNFYLDEANVSGSDKFHSSSYKLTSSIIYYPPYFDDFKKGDVKGLDDSYHMKAIKVIPYIMCLSAELKRIEEWGETKYGFHKGLKAKVKLYNVLVQKEYVSNNVFTEAPLKKHLKKYELLSSDEINTKIKEQQNTENTAILIIGRSFDFIYLSIIDIKTGDLLYFEDIQRKFEYSQKKVIGDEELEKLLSDLMKWNDK